MKRDTKIIRFVWLANRRSCFEVKTSDLRSLEIVCYVINFVVASGIILYFIESVPALPYIALCISAAIFIPRRMFREMEKTAIPVTECKDDYETPKFERIYQILLILIVVLFVSIELFIIL